MEVNLPRLQLSEEEAQQPPPTTHELKNGMEEINNRPWELDAEHGFVGEAEDASNSFIFVFVFCLENRDCDCKASSARRAASYAPLGNR
ncbi:hypothetical protein MRB53_008919 [Persea americana]|uniref:Uncharacterized protein n=1 Tax=Persea americana TaxID=3435 RepID=A0ACC2LNJ2_PERAE|nr:hypothetical protein MRB53_008919 [Persea americana]